MPDSSSGTETVLRSSGLDREAAAAEVRVKAASAPVGPLSSGALDVSDQSEALDAVFEALALDQGELEVITSSGEDRIVRRSLTTHSGWFRPECS